MSMIRKLAVWSTVAALSFSAPTRASDVRRVVTGVDADNKSTAIIDSKIALAPAPNDLKWAHLWVTDSYPLSISETDTKDKSVGISPPENGTQFGVVEIPPYDPAHTAQPLWHRTRTVDYVIVMSGEIDLMLEASVVHLKSGDTVVQQATNHAWVNRGTVPCRLLFVLMDAKQPKG
jgi:quercetin dioxygenase-like cupin family protein